MKSPFLSIAICLTAIAIISAASSFFTMRYMSGDSSYPRDDYHEWIHNKLKMTPEQDRRSLASELRYEETKRHLDEVIRLANLELAGAILKDKCYSSSVEKPVLEIQEALGQLQKATLEHIFELRETLDAEQYERLIEMTAQGISENTRRN